MIKMTNITNGKRKGYIKQFYSPNHPCPPPYFAGRKTHLRFYEDARIPKLENITPQPSNIAFTGEWGIGKTSIIRYLKRKKEKENFLIAETIQEFGEIEDLLSKSLKNIASAASKWEALKDAVSDKLEGIGISELELSFKEEKSLLVDRLKKTWEILENNGVEHCSLLVDDFGGLREKDQKTLRDIFQNLPSYGCNYSLIITCSERMFEKPAMEPVTRFFDKKSVKPFTEGEAKEAIYKPVNYANEELDIELDLDFNDEYVSELMNLTEGYPYFIKFVTKELALEKKHMRGEDLREKRSKLLEKLGKEKFLRDFKSIPKRSQKILVRMAGKPSEEFKAREFREVEQYSSYLKRLYDAGLVNKEEYGVYTIYHPLFSEWIKESGESAIP